MIIDNLTSLRFNETKRMLMNEKNDLVMFFNQSDIKEVFLVHELLSRPKSWSHDRSLGVLCCYMQLFKFKKTREKISNLSTILQSFVNPRLAYGVTGFIIWFGEEIFCHVGGGDWHNCQYHSGSLPILNSEEI